MSNVELIENKYQEAVQGIKEGFKKDGTGWYDYITHLPSVLRTTYLVVVLHNQVFNGGFHQYFVNGYGQFAKETIQALIDIEAFKKSHLLKEALAIVNSQSYPDEVFREKLLNKEIAALFIGDDLFDPLDKLDDEYYEDDDDIEELLGRYLQK